VLHDNPYDGHTLKQALDDMREIVGRSPLRVAVDQGYKGHRLTGHPRTAVYITGQRRGVTDKIKRWLQRRAVVEPIIGHAKNDGLLGRNWLQGRAGDRCNALLAAAGFQSQAVAPLPARSLSFFARFFLRRSTHVTYTHYPRNVNSNSKRILKGGLDNLREIVFLNDIIFDSEIILAPPRGNAGVSIVMEGRLLYDHYRGRAALAFVHISLFRKKC
jgi:hypothetical protein